MRITAKSNQEEQEQVSKWDKTTMEKFAWYNIQYTTDKKMDQRWTSEVEHEVLFEPYSRSSN